MRLTIAITAPLVSLLLMACECGDANLDTRTKLEICEAGYSEYANSLSRCLRAPTAWGEACRAVDRYRAECRTVVHERTR